MQLLGEGGEPLGMLRNKRVVEHLALLLLQLQQRFGDPFQRRRVAAGPYRVIDVAQAPAKAATTRVTLRAVAGDAATEFWVDVPDRALADRRIAKDEVVQVNERVYGYEFAYGDTKKAFFLALQDDWYRELASRKVTI